MRSPAVWVHLMCRTRFLSCKKKKRNSAWLSPVGASAQLMWVFYHHQLRQESDVTQKPPLCQLQVLEDLFNRNRKHFASWVATPHASKRAHRSASSGSRPRRCGRLFKRRGGEHGFSTVSLKSKVGWREEHICGAPACNLITHKSQKGPSERSCSWEESCCCRTARVPLDPTSEAQTSTCSLPRFLDIWQLSAQYSILLSPLMVNKSLRKYV